MARKRAYQERSFDPSRTVYVRKSFNGSGRKYKPGDIFDWKRLAVSQRRVRQLFDSGRLMHAEQEEQSEQRVDKPQPRRVDTEAGPMDVQTPDELDDISDMKELQRIAREEGAKTTTSKTLQRKHIRDNREGGGPTVSDEQGEPEQEQGEEEEPVNTIGDSFTDEDPEE